MKENELTELKEEISQAKDKVSESKGRLSGLTDELKKKWNCTSLKQLKEEREKKDQKKDQVQQQIDVGLNELEENYEL